jgi:hypothetical protein
MPHFPSRRRLLAGATALGLSLAAHGRAQETDDPLRPAPPLKDLIRHPLLLRSLYRLPVGDAYAPDGSAGANRDGYKWIEEQRQGAEWIVRGVAEDRADWRDLGWRLLDWGLSHQADDGGFGSRDPFHSTSFFVEALARACLLDPSAATDDRRRALARAAGWLMSPAAEDKGVPNNRPYTHRRYILAAAFGQSAAVTGETAFAAKAQDWAGQGLGLQRDDGTNPERDGYDAGYQMVGVLMALRYLPACDDPDLRGRLRAMVRKAVAPELMRLQPDGAIDMGGSTRIGIEHSRAGVLKDVPYGEIMQALVYGAQALPEPAWLAPAERIARYRKWLKG